MAHGPARGLVPRVAPAPAGCLLRALDRALCVRGVPRCPRTVARLTRGGYDPPSAAAATPLRRRAPSEARPLGDGSSSSLSIARQDLETDARHWAFLNRVGLQPETVHSLLQSAGEKDSGAGGVTGSNGEEEDASSFVGGRPASLAELVEVVEYLLSSGYGRNKDIITGLRTFFTRNETARFLTSLGVRDVGRTLVRFPQLLRYDVAAVLQPRAAFLQQEVGVTDVGLAISRHPMLLIYRRVRMHRTHARSHNPVWAPLRR